MASAIVTGALQGIGRAIALQLADDGYNVTLNDLPNLKEKLEEVQSLIIAKGKKSIVVTGDVTIESDIQNLMDATVPAFGELNVMVASAGLMITKGLLGSSLEEFSKVLAVNTTGIFLCYQKAGKQMTAQGKGGKIVGACSISGYRPSPTALAYGVSKWGVRGLTQAAAQELAPFGINVNAYCAGMVRTQMWDAIDASFMDKLGVPKGATWDKAVQDRIAMKKAQTPKDIAGCVGFLVGKDASIITGQSLIVDGGIVFS